MSEKFYSLLTNIGKAKIANSVGLGTKINFSIMKVGDGGGSYYDPTEDQTDLKNVVWQGNINHVEIDEENPNWINIEVMIPSTVGGFTIREYGAFDEEGNMLGICKCAETYKPVIADGSTKELLLNLVLAISNTSTVSLKVDPTIIFAKKSEVEQLRADINTQLSDMVYQTAGGSATVITLTIKGTLVTGYPITFIASANNGGVATKINGKSVYKPGTTTPPNFIKDKAYTVWYNSISDCFFIKASAEGTAVATNVLAGTTFSNDIDTGIPGGMANNGAVSSTLTNNNQEYVIPAGFHNGLGKIKAIITNLAAAVIKAGTTVGGIVGTFTSDATAVAADIINGKTAYVNSNKITGNATIKSLGGYGVGDIIDAESLSYSFTSIRSTTDYKNIPKMVHDSSGNYYILDGTYVRKFNSSGTLQWSYNCGNTVMDIAINILGTYIYIADGNANSNINGNIRKISSSGVQAWAYPVTSYYMDSLDIDSTENVYASSNSSSNYGYIYKINSSGTLQWSVSVYGAGARALVLDSSANIYLAVFSSSYSSATIYKYNSNGTMLAPTSGVGISYFSKICIDSANNIYVLVETGSLAVLYKYDTNLNIIKSLNFSNDNVQEITVNKAKNTLRLAHYDTGRISRLDSDFNILSTIQTGIKSTPIYSVNMVADNVVALSNSIQTIFYKEQFTITS